MSTSSTHLLAFMYHSPLQEPGFFGDMADSKGKYGCNWDILWPKARKCSEIDGDMPQCPRNHFKGHPQTLVMFIITNNGNRGL